MSNKYIGDYAPGAIINHLFTTCYNSTAASASVDGIGPPATFGGTPTVSIYKDGSATQWTTTLTSGAGLTIGFDSITGLNLATLDTSADGTFFSAGSEFSAVITTGTSTGTLVGQVIFKFTLGRVSMSTAALVRAALGMAAADLDTQLATIDNFIDTEVAAIVSELAKVPKSDSNVVHNATAIAAIQSGLATAAALDTVDNFLDTEIAALQADTDDIQARLPAALTAGGNMKADALAISGSTAASDGLEESTEAIAYGTVDGTGATSTVFLTSALTPDSAVNDQFNGRVLIFKNDTTTAALRGQATTISDWAHTSAEIGTFTVVALTTAPQTGDTFVIL